MSMGVLRVWTNCDRRNRDLARAWEESNNVGSTILSQDAEVVSHGESGKGKEGSEDSAREMHAGG